MNNKTRFILSLLIICASGLSLAQVVTTASVNSTIMQTIGEWADKDTVVFIDLDDTLMIPKSLMFSYNSNFYRGFISEMLYLGERAPSYNIAVAKWYQQREVRLVEEAWPQYIEKLRSKGAAVYGMCRMPLHLVNIEEKRYLESKGLNIVFTNEIHGKEVLEIEKQENWFSFFYKGIIFTGPYSNSHTLIEFLRVSEVPKKIIFISNVKEEVNRVEKSLRVFDMKFYNIHYLGAKKLRGEPDSKIVKFQQMELINKGIWLEDDAAKTALDKYLEEQKASLMPDDNLAK